MLDDTLALAEFVRWLLRGRALAGTYSLACFAAFFSRTCVGFAVLCCAVL